MRPVVLIFFVFIILIVVCGNYIVAHEAVHAQIWKRYGANPEVRINWLTFSGQTTISADEAWKCNSDCKTQQAFTDIIGYNTALIIISTWGMFAVYMAYRMLYHEYGQKKA